MGNKCSVCGITDVVSAGDVCELCSIAQDPYAKQQTTPSNLKPASTSSAGSLLGGSKKRGILLNGGGGINTNVSPFTTGTYAPPAQTTVSAVSPPASSGAAAAIQQPQKAPAAKSNAASPVTSGITKNVNTDSIQRSALFRWFRAVFTSIPFTIDNDVTTFQVFPDYSSQTLNVSGYACDQAVIYGKVPAGLISENNDVEVYGKRDSKGKIIATTIINTASGTTVKAHWSINASVVKAITALIFAVISACTYFAVVGVGGIREAAVWFLGIVIGLAVLIFLIRHPRAIIALLGVAFLAVFGVFKGLFKMLFKRW